MTNFEYYIKGNRFEEGWRVFVETSYNKIGRALNQYNKWLLEEHEEPILDDIEKEYLSNIIKPFKDTVLCVTKETKDTSVKMARIRIAYRNGSSTCLPWFLKEKMYVNMLSNTYYTLKELGL